ncbi:MAG: low-specificity L-threonine aldolase [Clostridiales bacterium]|nr:low-specificity L-threonine aldolase [Clostridiales bacterium]
MKNLDFRSDTVTQPTEKMRQAMANAVVGDDVYGDDPTMNKLEMMAAEILGKEAALFVPSGHFGNQVSILTHTNRGNEIIVGHDAHIVWHEVGAAAVISGVQVRTIHTENGVVDLDELKGMIRGEDIHYPDTGLVCMENAHGTGKVVPLEHMKEVYEIAKNHGIPVHLDGARLFNAALALGVEAAELTQYCDSVNICLSKGLAAPVGSIVAGTKEFINKARKNRKLMGGGMRQVGILGAAGLIAMTDMVERLYIDHDNAKYLADRLKEIKGLSVLEDRLDINMVFFNATEEDFPEEKIVNGLFERNIKVNGIEGGEWRFVTNKDIEREDIDRLIIALKEILDK